MTTPAPRLLTVADVADRLKCHPETIRRAIRRSDLACYRMLGCIRISEEQLEAYLQQSISIPIPAVETCARRPSEIVRDFQLARRMQRAIDKR